MPYDAAKMPDESTLDREQQALSFNPFGDSFEDHKHDDDRELQLARTAEQAMTHLLDISSLSIRDGRSSSNASSAISAHTIPLFDGIDAGAGQADSSRPFQAAPPPSSFLNPTAGLYNPSSSSVPANTTGLASSSSSIKSIGKVSSSGDISISMGIGAGPPRRHRLSSASSVKSTRSRRSTSSSISSLNSRIPASLSGQQGEDDTTIVLPEVADSNNNFPGLSGPPLTPAQLLRDRSHSQESILSLQPSVLSLETTAKSPPPVAGYRVPATGSLQHSSFPQLSLCGPAFKDFDDHPIYVCSAILGTAIHPAKAGPHLLPPVRMSFAGKEILHEGRFDLLPITASMKWCDAKDGAVPEGREPIQGGYEESGEQLYHALARIQGYWVPGKTGLHLKGANFPFAGREVRLREGYKVLCWAKSPGSAAASETTEIPETRA